MGISSPLFNEKGHGSNPSAPRQYISSPAAEPISGKNDGPWEEKRKWRQSLDCAVKAARSFLSPLFLKDFNGFKSSFVGGRGVFGRE
ncbi:hypothetical protein ACOMHN_039143 [Nucella lapillus]